jgi:hypothetical protein
MLIMVMSQFGRREGNSKANACIHARRDGPTYHPMEPNINGMDIDSEMLRRHIYRTCRPETRPGARGM